jgi:uncharacterized membrane protein
VFISLRHQLRRHRREAALALAVLALGFTGLAAHSALMRTDMGSHIGSAASICLTVGGCAVFIGVAVFGLRRRLQRPRWVIAAPLTLAPLFIPADTAFLIRAGPPSLLQVFRL